MKYQKGDKVVFTGVDGSQREGWIDEIGLFPTKGKNSVEYVIYRIGYHNGRYNVFDPYVEDPTGELKHISKINS